MTDSGDRSGDESDDTAGTVGQPSGSDEKSEGTGADGGDPDEEGSDAGGTSIKLFFLHSSARIVGFFGLVFFARNLSQSELGVYFLFFLVVQVSSMVSQVGVTSAIVQRISGSDRPEEIYTAALTVFGTISIGLTLLLFAPGVRGAVAGYVGVDVPALLALAIGSWLFADLHIRAVQGEDRVLVTGLLQLVQDVVRVGVGAVAITVGLGAIGLMYGVIAGFGVTVLIGFFVVNVQPRVPARRDFRSLFAISKYTAIFGPTNFIYFWFDTFMIGLLLTKAAVSSYEVAWQTTRVLIIPTTAIVQTVFPKVSRWASEGDYDEIERILPGAVLFTLFIPLPGLVGLAVLGTDILRLIYRPGYAEAALPMAILAGYMVIESLHRLGQVLTTGIDRAEIPFRSRLVGVTLAIVLNVALIPPLGLLGAAIGTFLAKLVDASLLWLRTAAIVEVDLPIRPLLWELGSAFAMGLIVAGGATLIGISSLPVLFALVGFGVVFYAIAVLRDEDIHRVLDQYVPISLPGG